ncbi:MAG: mcp64H-4 [Nitrospirae bacterium]|nr:mcp64H-4 [Nitrospirota bacterium]
MMLRFTLQKKAIFIVSGILFFVIAVNTGVLTYIAYERYKTAILSKSAAIGEGMQREISKIVNLGVHLELIEGLNEKLQELISRDEAIGHSMVMDRDGIILYHSDIQKIGIRLSDEVYVNARSSKKMLVQTAAPLYNLSFPILDSEEKLAGVLVLGVKMEVIKARLYELLKWVLGISALCFAISLVFVYFAISRFITEPIIVMEKGANRIASGDLTETIHVKGEDEVANLGKAINRMAFNLKDMIAKIVAVSHNVSRATENVVVTSREVLDVSDMQKGEIQSATLAVQEMGVSMTQVSESTKSLSHVAHETSSAVMETKTSMESIAENANINSESAQETASIIEELLANIKQVADSTEKLTDSSIGISSSIEEVNSTTRDIDDRAKESVVLADAVMKNASERGMKALNAAIKGMQDIKSDIFSLSETVNKLGKKSVDIGRILNVIDDVADRTTLLALNAAILASQSGEHGKGFAVVAEEIKALARRTTESTSEIAGLITSVQTETSSSVKMVSDSIKTVENGMKLVNDLNETLKSIIESSKASTSMARAIQRATEEEALVINNITASIEHMTGQTGRISSAMQEQSKGSNFIIKETEKGRNLSSNIQKAVNEQKEGISRMAELAENIFEQTVQIASATGRQEEKSIEIVKSMDKIRSTSSALADASNSMNEIISLLHKDAMNLLEEMNKFKV